MYIKKYIFLYTTIEASNAVSLNRPLVCWTRVSDLDPVFLTKVIIQCLNVNNLDFYVGKKIKVNLINKKKWVGPGSGSCFSRVWIRFFLGGRITIPLFLRGRIRIRPRLEIIDIVKLLEILRYLTNLNKMLRIYNIF